MGSYTSVMAWDAADSPEALLPPTDWVRHQTGHRVAVNAVPGASPRGMMPSPMAVHSRTAPAPLGPSNLVGSLETGFSTRRSGANTITSLTPSQPPTARSRGPATQDALTHSPQGSHKRRRDELEASDSVEQESNVVVLQLDDLFCKTKAIRDGKGRQTCPPIYWCTVGEEVIQKRRSALKERKEAATATTSSSVGAASSSAVQA